MIKLAGLSLLIIVCLGCEWQGANTSDAQHVVQLQKSQVNKGAGVKLNYENVGAVYVGQEVVLPLSFQFKLGDKAEFTVKMPADLQLVGTQQFSLQADERGHAAYNLRFVPQQEGKAYIKLFAIVLRDGDTIPQVFSMPVYVGDDAGVVTINKTNTNSRVELPSSRN